MATITSVTSSSGGSKGTIVKIVGSGFTTAKAVHFGGSSAAFIIVSDTIIVAVLPSTATTGKVQVILTDGSSAETSSNFVVNERPKPELQYTNRSFEEIRQQLVSYIQNTSPLSEHWTDFNESNPEMVLLELLSAIGAELNFYLDNQANESFLPTARQRKSVVNLCKLIAYKLDNVVSSEGLVTFQLLDPLSVSITIPKYTRLKTSGGGLNIPFVTTEEVSIPAGTLAVDAKVRQGVLIEEEFIASGTAEPNQAFGLARKDVASNFGSIEVLVGQGADLSLYEQWSEKPNFIIRTPDDDQKIFVVDVDHKDNTLIKFGDGKFGAIPPANYSVVVRYLSSMGEAGNVGSLTVTSIEDAIKTSQNVEVNIEVFNAQACVGGAARETIEHAKRQAPQELSALYRGVTKQDVRALVDGISGVSKVATWGEHELPHPDIKHFNQMYITFLSDGVVPSLTSGPVSWLPTEALKNKVTDYLEERKIITTRAVYVDPEVIFIDLEVDVFVDPSASNESVQQKVYDLIKEFFDLDHQAFGQEVRYSKLINYLEGVANVEHLRVKLKRNGITFTPTQGVAGGSVVIKGADFSNTTSVRFNGIEVTNFSLQSSDRELLVTLPAGNTSGHVEVTLDNGIDAPRVLVSPYPFGPRVDCPIDRDGDDPVSDASQWEFNEQDIIVRRNELCQLGELYNPADGGIIPTGIRILDAKDDEPIRAKVIYSPLHAPAGETVAFNGDQSSSPHGNIVTWQWNMGAKGTLMQKQSDGTFLPHPIQPSDGQTVSSYMTGVDTGGSPTVSTEAFSTIYWKYTTRPSNGYVTVVLTVFDDVQPEPNCHASAVTYKIDLF